MNLEGQQGDTPLMLAVSLGQMDAIRLLHRYGEFRISLLTEFKVSHLRLQHNVLPTASGLFFLSFSFAKTKVKKERKTNKKLGFLLNRFEIFNRKFYKSPIKGDHHGCIS